MLNKYWKTKIKDGVLDLGTMNGWDRETSAMFSELSIMKIAKSESGQNLGRCYNAYAFNVELDGQLIEVRYKVDSGD